MAEFEELRLTVTLANNASAGVTKLQQQMKELSTGPSAVHMEKFKRESSLLRDLTKTLGLEATGAGKSFEALGTRALGAAGGVVAFVGALVVATKQLNDFSVGVESLGKRAKQSGTDYATLKNIADQFYVSIGINEDQSAKIVEASLALQVEARKQYSKQFHDIGTETRAPELADQLKETMAKAKPPEELVNDVLDYLNKLDEAEKNRGNYTDENQLKAMQAARRRVALEQMHIDIAVQGATKLTNLTAERRKFLNELNERVTTFAQTWRAIWQTVREINDLFLLDILNSPVLTLLLKAKELTDWIFNRMEEGEQKMKGKTFWDFWSIDPKIVDFFRKNSGILGEVTPRAGVPAPTGAEAPLISNYGPLSKNIEDRRGEAMSSESLDANTRELKRLNDQLYTMLNPPDKAGAGAGAGNGSNALTNTGMGPLPTSVPSVPNASPPPPPSRGYGPSNPPPAGVFPTPGLFEHTPMGIAPPGGGGGADDIPTNALGFLRGIARTEGKLTSGIETQESRREAYADATNRMSYGTRTGMYDYGYLQMAQRDVDFAVNKLGMSPDQAQHLMGGRVSAPGGQGTRSTADQQLEAGNEFLKRWRPEAYRKLIENNDYQGMVHATRGSDGSYKWFGLRDHPADALSEFNKTRDAARVGGAAVAVGGPPAAADQPAAVRTTIDANAAARVRQLIEASGHLRIDVPSAQSGPSPSERLFQRSRPGRSIQMQPTAVGPPEPAAVSGF